MKNKKVILSTIITIAVLLIITILGITLNVVNNNNKAEVGQEVANNLENQENIDNDDNTEYKSDVNNIQELRSASVEGNSIIDTVSSRSQVNREERLENVYVNTNSEEQQAENEYEEIKQYTKLEDVRISFDMDVSKTTGLSKEDFVTLVQNMKYDKTGILEKNAAWIWECCQKYNVNEIFVLGICGIESGWCSEPQHQSTHNYSSLMSGGKLIPYASDEAGFEAMIKLLGQKYLTPGASLYHGATITGVGKCYCNPTTWPKKVYTCMQQVFQ